MTLAHEGIVAKSQVTSADESSKNKILFSIFLYQIFQTSAILLNIYLPIIGKDKK